VLQAFALVGHRGSQVILEAGIPGIPKGVVCHKAPGDGCDPAHFWKVIEISGMVMVKVQFFLNILWKGMKGETMLEFLVLHCSTPPHQSTKVLDQTSVFPPKKSPNHGVSLSKMINQLDTLIRFDPEHFGHPHMSHINGWAPSISAVQM